MTTNFLTDFAIGGVSTAVTQSILSPMERIQFIFMTKSVNPSIKKSQRSMTIRTCVEKIFRKEGLKAFWRGNTSIVTRSLPSTALNFSLKNFYQGLFDNLLNKKRLMFGEKTKEIGFWMGFGRNLVAGGLAGVTSLTLTYPLDMLRVRMAVDMGSSESRKYKSVTHCFKKITKSEGLRGFYKGLGISVLGGFLYRALVFGLYDTFKGKYEGSIFKKYLMAQGFSSVAGFMTYPLYTIRTRLMVQESSSGKMNALYKGSLDCFKKVMRKEGVKGLFGGYAMNFLGGVSGSIVVVVFDEMSTGVREK